MSEAETAPPGFVWFAGPTGRLEGHRSEPASDLDRGTHAALFCHAHPLHGGTLHSKLVYQAASAARDRGIPALRFNFRGVGGSAGSFDHGRGESLDTRAALDALAGWYPGRRLVAGGFSFGAWMAVAAAAADPRVSALVSIGTPIGIYGSAYLEAITKPILFVHGAEDRYGPVAEIAGWVAGHAQLARLVSIEGAGHLLAGHETRVRSAVGAFLGGLLDECRQEEKSS